MATRKTKEILARKAAMRSAIDWLDMMELPADPEISVDVDLSDLMPTRNAAEVWAESLPDLAIWQRRRELDARSAAPVVVRALAKSAAMPRLPVAKSAFADALRNAGILALVLLAVAACARMM